MIDFHAAAIFRCHHYWLPPILMMRQIAISPLALTFRFRHFAIADISFHYGCRYWLSLITPHFLSFSPYAIADYFQLSTLAFAAERCQPIIDFAEAAISF